MAAISAIGSPPSTSQPFNSRRHTISFQCSARPQEKEERAPQLLKLAVSGATQLLRLLTPNNNSNNAKNSEKVGVASSMDDVVEMLRLDYQNAYFLTGNFTSDLYAEDCLFEDPTIEFRGKDRYSRNLTLLVPFLEQPSLQLEKIEKGLDENSRFVLANWKLRTYLKFPWRPLISIRGATVYDLDKELKIIRHAESWSVSALEAVGQIFSPGIKDRD